MAIKCGNKLAKNNLDYYYRDVNNMLWRDCF
jgi:hypothetical protein